MTTNFEFYVSNKGVLTGRKLKAYFREHVEPVRGFKNIYKVTTPIKAFKQILFECPRILTKPGSYNLICALSIPVGALVHVDFTPGTRSATLGGWVNFNEQKLRASEAIVHSIYTFSGKRLQVNKSSRSKPCSIHDNKFLYWEGKHLTPESFSMQPTTCAPGIHFFLNFREAFNYS